MHIDLQALLMEHGNAKTEHIREIKLPDCPLSILQIRDRLYLLGSILHEDLEHQVYVAAIRSGFADMGHAVVALQLQGNTLNILGYAKEGIIKQHICEKALQKLVAAIQGKKVSGSSRSRIILPIILFAVVIAGFVTIRGYAEKQAEKAAFDAMIQQTISATQEYNKAVEQFNASVEEYNHAVSLICIDNIDGLPAVLEILKKESDGYDEIVEAVENGILAESITTDTNTIREMTAQVEALTAVVKQITAPTAEWITERLASISSISGTQAVTEDLDPDQLLGKEGG